MTKNIKPLRKALENTGPITLSSTPVLGGFLSVIFCALFAGFSVLIFAIINSPPPYELFLQFFGGSLLGATFAVGIQIAITISIIFDKTDAHLKILFFIGGLVGYIVHFTAGYAFYYFLRSVYF